MISISIKVLILVATTLYQAIACWLENRKTPPGPLFDVGGYRLHLYLAGEGSPTIILDHSLGGIDGYFLVEELAKLSRVCIYDRAGYGIELDMDGATTAHFLVPAGRLWRN